MRSKSVEMLFDRLFWLLLLIAPVLVFFIGNNRNSITFIEVLNQFHVNDTNLIYTILSGTFGNDGILEFLDTSTTNPVLLYLSYMAILELCHLVFDTLLFIPRICVNLIDKATEMGSGVKRW